MEKKYCVNVLPGIVLELERYYWTEKSPIIFSQTLNSMNIEHTLSGEETNKDIKFNLVNAVNNVTSISIGCESFLFSFFISLPFLFVLLPQY